MSRSVNVAIIGTGVVGAAFINQLKNLQSVITFNVVYLARSRTALIARDYQPLALASWEADVQAATTPTLALSELAQFLRAGTAPAILIDNTSNEEIASFYPSFIEQGISIATPNKKAFSSGLQTWKQIFAGAAKPAGGLVYHEATVGAGLPIIGTLRDIVATGDKVQKIEGIFSGTLSYIFNEFSTPEGKDVNFSDVVAVAKSLGYTEPDPRDDLNGLDVARKVTILARIAGFEVESPTSFPVHSLIPKALESVKSGEEYMEKLPEFDGDMETLKENAAKQNKVLRFVGKVDFPSNTVSVGIEEYSFDHPFAALKGSDNVVSIQTERYQNPLIVQGAGAGAEVTAAGVLADAIKIAERIAK
ncbi:hypothetical protein BABINDRAFT_78241 [Babjeviella inositovora NRRL Y-12698]|uniref:Homoserine dehydrogenase n=1 Tax=Babjeviella inositovora NRRL Y-12698 TaxID=984486 RepID=A0A1E3QYZ4_9ASCO|nr:uncharacterized protein BABINDRAFT_78241 [Babjeviella inositovora NRRL Y-12698]ODQ82909.1 hypothetical protein BABINDRAFT_78241 [Babjeviella inositovora NRRL Y-12698]